VSPLFGRRRSGGQAPSPGEAQERDRRDAESLERLQQGRIPLAAAERLAALASSGPDAARVFSSDLSVAEFALLHNLGIEPITLVMGSSIYHVGWQNVYYNAPTEFTAVSHAFNESRRLALGRLREEAQTAGADAVVGVRIEQGSHDWAAGSVEFVAVGTAVQLPPALRDPSSGPVLTDLGGQEFWQLCTDGIRPVAIVAATSVHYAPASYQTMQVQSGFFGSSWRNQELPDYTAGMYAARHKAMAEIANQARAADADGIVGVHLDQHVRGHHVQQPGMDREDLIVTLHVIGTAVRGDPALARTAHPPRTVLALGRPLERSQARTTTTT